MGSPSVPKEGEAARVEEDERRVVSEARERRSASKGSTWRLRFDAVACSHGGGVGQCL